MNSSFRSVLPSKKFLISLAIIAVIVIAIIVISNIDTNKSNDAATITVGEIARSDSDSNGTPDWQDKLYKDNNRIEYPTTQNSNPRAPNYTIPNETQTTQLARDMYTAINTLAEGETLNPTARKNLQNMLSEYIESVAEPKTWTPNDITVVGNNEAAIAQYIAEFSVLTGLYKPTPNPIPMLESAVRLNDPTGLKKLLSREVNMHQDALTGLQSMSVPQQAVDYHLDITNAIQAIHDDVLNMSKHFSDPLLTFSAVLRYNKDAQSLVDAINAINQNFFEQYIE